MTMPDTPSTKTPIKPSDHQLLAKYGSLAIRSVRAAAAFRPSKVTLPTYRRARLVPGAVCAGVHGSD